MIDRIDWMSTLGWNEDHLEEFRNAGYAYIRQGRYEDALPFYEALYVLNPNNFYDVQTLGALYVQLNKPKEAIKYLDLALQLEADQSPTLFNLAKAFFMDNRAEEGVKLATMLQKDQNPFIASQAAALILAYRKEETSKT